jgi:hypothetical protein
MLSNRDSGQTIELQKVDVAAVDFVDELRAFGALPVFQHDIIVTRCR